MEKKKKNKVKTINLKSPNEVVRRHTNTVTHTPHTRSCGK